MCHPFHAIVVMCVAASIASGCSAPGRTIDAPAARDMQSRTKASVADLAWMSGRWTMQTKDGSDLEEIWSQPMGDALMGSFRWHRKGKAWMYELMSITEEESEVVFRLRHFDAKLSPWEKDDPLRYALTKSTANEVVFENPERDSPRRFIYKRDGDTLIIRLEPVDPNQHADEFRLIRAGPS